MGPGPPKPGDMRPRNRRTVGAVGVVAGVALALVAVMSLALDAISAEQAVAIATPGIVLIISGLIVATLPDPETGRRLGFRAGVSAGSLLGRWRAGFRSARDGQLPRSNEPSNNEAELRVR